MDDEQFHKLTDGSFLVEVQSLAHNYDYVKCPRCWHYHTIKINHDGLCDRCCRVMLQNFQNHPSTPLIAKSLEMQRNRFEVKE